MKSSDERLFLHEAALLLALRDREGTIVPGTMYHYALGGALVAELLLNGRAVVDAEKKRQFLRIVDTRRIGEPLLDDCLDVVARAPRRATLQAWVSKLANIKKLKHRIAERLCRAGVLRVDEDRVLLIFSRKVYPEVDPRPEKRLIEGMRGAILSESTGLDARTAVLIALARHAGLLKVVLTKAELKARKARIEQIVSGQAVGKAVKNAIEAMQAAIVVAAVIPAICASN